MLSPIKENSPLVSVIIPTRNSGRTIEKCLSSIHMQTYKNIELIVADGSSIDSTLVIAKKYGALVLIFPSTIERTEKKNQAAHFSRGKYLYFIDSDNVLSPKVIEKCCEACNKGADAVIISERIVGESGFWAKCRELEIEMYDGDNNVESAHFFKREIFFDAGKFDENLVFGEENDLTVRVRNTGARIVRITELLYHYEGPLKSVIMRKLYYGSTSPNYIRKSPRNALSQFSFIRIGWIMNRRKMMKNPAYAFGMIIQKGVQYLAAMIGLMLWVFKRKNRSGR